MDVLDKRKKGVVVFEFPFARRQGNSKANCADTLKTNVTLGLALGNTSEHIPFFLSPKEPGCFEGRPPKERGRVEGRHGLQGGLPPHPRGPPGKFQRQTRADTLKTISPLDQRWENFGAHSLFFFFLSKIAHLLIEID